MGWVQLRLVNSSKLNQKCNKDLWTLARRAGETGKSGWVRALISPLPRSSEHGHIGGLSRSFLELDASCLTPVIHGKLDLPLGCRIVWKIFFAINHERNELLTLRINPYKFPFDNYRFGRAVQFMNWLFKAQLGCTDLDFWASKAHVLKKPTRTAI